jgi:hypothetical protein
MIQRLSEHHVHQPVVRRVAVSRADGEEALLLFPGQPAVAARPHRRLVDVQNRVVEQPEPPLADRGREQVRV